MPEKKTVKYKSYYDIQKDILQAKLNLKAAEAELKKLIKLSAPSEVIAIDYGKAQSNPQFTPDAEQIKRISECQNEIIVYREYLEGMEREGNIYASAVKRIADKCNNLELKVFYRHHIKRQSLKKISIDYGYSHVYIREINARIKRKIQENIPHTTYT